MCDGGEKTDLCLLCLVFGTDPNCVVRERYAEMLSRWNLSKNWLGLTEKRLANR